MKKALATGIVVMLVNVLAVLAPASHAFAGNHHNLHSQNRMGFRIVQYKRNTACGWFYLTNNGVWFVTSDGIGNTVRLGVGSEICVTSWPDGAGLKLYYNNNPGQCLFQDGNVPTTVKTYNCNVNDRHDYWHLASTYESGDWYNTVNPYFAIVYTKYVTNGSRLFIAYVVPSGGWSNWTYP